MSSLQNSQPTFLAVAPRLSSMIWNKRWRISQATGLCDHVSGRDVCCSLERDEVDLHLNYSPDAPSGHSVCWIGVTNIEALYQQYLPTHAVQSPLEAKP